MVYFLLQMHLWMLFDTVLCGQHERCETYVSKLQCFAGSLQAAVTVILCILYIDICYMKS